MQPTFNAMINSKICKRLLTVKIKKTHQISFASLSSPNPDTKVTSLTYHKFFQLYNNNCSESLS